MPDDTRWMPTRRALLASTALFAAGAGAAKAESLGAIRFT